VGGFSERAFCGKMRKYQGCAVVGKMADRQELSLHNDHNVYILGAGFSAPAGLPVIANFMNTMRDGIYWLQANSRLDEARAVERVLEFRRRAAGAAERVPLDLENIEEIFSLASGSGDPTLIQSATLAIAATLDFAETTKLPQPLNQGYMIDDPNFQIPVGWQQTGALGNFEGRPSRAFSFPLYDFILLILSGGQADLPRERRDTIITFNYDLLVEKALRNLRVPFDYGFEKSKPYFHDSFIRVNGSRTPVPVLKLHGSVNWAVTESGLGIYGDYNNVRQLPLTGPMLVPPTWNKTLSPALSDVWDSAVVALSTATRIVVIGYSIPVTDNYFKYLVATGLQENVSLRKIIFVDIDPQGISQRVRALFRPELNPRILEIIPSDTESFFRMHRHKIERNFVLPFVG